MLVRAYPVVERDGLVWIWMGEPSRANAREIPDLSYLSDAAHWRTVRSYFHFPFGADLMVDNLMDLSHVEFLHKGTLSEGYQQETRAAMTTEETGNAVRVSWVLHNTVPTPYIRKTFLGIGDLADDYRDTYWQPPGIVKVELAYVKSGSPRNEGMRRIHTHCATPETATTMHDFTMRSRNFSLDSEDMDRELLRTQRIVVVEEDGSILTQIQQRMGTASFDSLDAVLFHVDAGATRVRRVMKQLIDLEAAASPQAS
jgi:vanillate O-demethylase monooxygenase subunit